MKKLLAIVACAAALLMLTQCSISRKVIAKAYPIGFTELHNYYVVNTHKVKKIERKIITSEEEFRNIFGEAAVMGTNGTPTPVNFKTQFVLAVILPETNRVVSMYPENVLENGNAVIFNYKVDKGEKTSYTMVPFTAIALDRPLEMLSMEFYFEEK
jgi:hypothetical protein